jgi:Ca-activated chloride channel homolog
MRFDSPWAFLLLLIIPVLVWLSLRGKRPGSIRFSTINNATRAGRSLRQRLSILLLILRVAALVLLTVALARPQKGMERIRDVNKGIAIEMLVDRSGSMRAEMEYKDARMTRLDVVKRVFEEFVLGNKDDLPGRPNDLIGMIAFARYPDTICPLTLAHGALPRFLENVKLVTRRSEDGTSIGDAIALAAARLKTAEETLAQQQKDTGKDYEIKSKIIILLTDGENNSGKRHPLQAAELAKEWGIKIYTIGVGGGDSVTTIQTALGSYKVPMGRGVDDRTLREVAKSTGGIYREADSAESLAAVYKEIDELERSEIDSIRYVDYKEKFVLFALAALCLAVLEIGLSCTVFRRIP